MPVPDPLVQGSASLRLSDLVRPATEAESAAEDREAAALSGEEETRPRAAPPAKQPSPPSFGERLFDELGFPRTESELGRRNDAGPRESGAVPWSGREFDRGGWHEQGEQLALALEAIAHRFRTGELAAPQFDAAVGDAAALAAALAAVLGIRS
jgi:hypothetical protein